ncbi:hypothetical protein [Plasticicumulans sp.]|uniref:hypothetical protein n=1 Tax=Plasticicumulans sp. TaxID=2307179 RepID=UPI00392DE896
MSALLAVMQSSTSGYQLAALGHAYAATAAKLDEKGASEAVSALLAAMQSSTDSDQLAALGQAYAAAAAKLDEKVARASEAVSALLAAMKSSTSRDQLAALGEAYAAVAKRLPSTALSGALDELITAVKPSGDRKPSITQARLQALTMSAAALIARMQARDAADMRMREFLQTRAASGASWDPFFTALAEARKSGDDVPAMLAVAMSLQSLPASGIASAGQ